MACRSSKNGMKTAGIKEAKKGANAQQLNCCNPNLICDIPRDDSGNFDPEGIIPECIFVDKVHDAVLINSTFPFGQDVDTGIAVGDDAEIIGVAVIDCKPVRNPNDPARLVITPTTTIPGAVLGRTIIGPGGLEQVEIFIEDNECAEEIPPQGRPITGRQITTITGAVDITYQVAVIGLPAITRTVRVPIPQPAVLTNSFQLCLPPTGGSPFLPQFAEFCGAICEAFLATGTLGDATIINGRVFVNTDIFLCISCEKKIKAPAQLCVLTNGECVPDEQQPFGCPEFPNLFPIQIEPGPVPRNN